MPKLIRQRYSDEEYKLIESAAKEAGLTIAAYCKSAVITAVCGSKKNRQIELVNLLQKGLDSLEPGSTFIVSDLVDSKTWNGLSRSEKNTLAKQLSRKVRDSEGKYDKYAVFPDRVTQYIKH